MQVKEPHESLPPCNGARQNQHSHCYQGKKRDGGEEWVGGGEERGWVGERKGEMICDTFWVRFQGVLLSDLCVRQLQCVTERGKPKQIQRV